MSALGLGIQKYGARVGVPPAKLLSVIVEEIANRRKEKAGRKEQSSKNSSAGFFQDRAELVRQMVLKEQLDQENRRKEEEDRNGTSSREGQEISSDSHGDLETRVCPPEERPLGGGKIVNLRIQPDYLGFKYVSPDSSPESVSENQTGEGEDGESRANKEGGLGVAWGSRQQQDGQKVAESDLDRRISHQSTGFEGRSEILQEKKANKARVGSAGESIGGEGANKKICGDKGKVSRGKIGKNRGKGGREEVG